MARKMPNHKEHEVKQRRNEHPLKNLPTEVLLKARSTLVSLGGALKPRHDQHRIKQSKEAKSKKNQDRLKNSRSEPEFGDIRKKHRSRADDIHRDYGSPKPRPLSVGATKRYEDDMDFESESYSKDMSPLHRQFNSTDEVCVQSRLVIPVAEKHVQDVQMPDINGRPRKKLSFREPEIIGSGSATLGRSNKLMGVNSLSRRPNRISLRSSLECLDSDLESQAMRIVRTVGQAFEVCHKMQASSPDHPAPSTSTAADKASPSCSDAPTPKAAPASDCGASESGGASASKTAAEEVSKPSRPNHLDLLPPPPRKENSRRAQPTPASTLTPNLPGMADLPDLTDLSASLPECVTKVEVNAVDDTGMPLSSQHQVKLLREQLEQQAQQTRAAVAQLVLLRDQLAVEQAARFEAQTRTHQLLVHNKELLEHISALISHLHERENGSPRPISAQQLTLLPQAEAAVAMKPNNAEKSQSCNGKLQNVTSDDLINFFTSEKNNNTLLNEEVEKNNNVKLNIPTITTSSPTPTSPLAGKTNDQIQEYLISKFQDMGVNGPEPDPMTHKQFYQNSNAFPNIAPLTNHCSNSDLASLLNQQAGKEKFDSSDEMGAIGQAMSLGQSQNSLFSNSQSSSDSSSDDFSSDDGVPYIMPLSHNATLTATGDDGRIRLIVPVSPSESSSDVAGSAATSEPKPVPSTSKSKYGNTLTVPEPQLSPVGPITRTTSEKVPNRSELMTALRSQWTRHTTK